MKKQFIILSLVGIAFMGTSCGNSKTEAAETESKLDKARKARGN